MFLSYRFNGLTIKCEVLVIPLGEVDSFACVCRLNPIFK